MEQTNSEYDDKSVPSDSLIKWNHLHACMRARVLVLPDQRNPQTQFCASCGHKQAVLCIMPHLLGTPHSPCLSKATNGQPNQPQMLHGHQSQSGRNVTAAALVPVTPLHTCRDRTHRFSASSTYRNDMRFGFPCFPLCEECSYCKVIQQTVNFGISGSYCETPPP